MKFDDYVRHDAISLADLVSKGEVTAGELLDTALARTADVNGAINAITVDLADEARTAIKAGLPEGPLHGVPYPIKDIGATMKGVVTSAGSRLFKEPAAADSAIVTSYREAGLSMFGKTNTPEFGLAAVTEPVLRGPSRNPWNTDLTPGGSSGGAAAAVAAGIVPAAHASDGGGSIRVPAACCGLFGMKPSRGRVSQAPEGEGWGGLTVQNCVSRTVRDGAKLLDIACGPQPGDVYWMEKPETPFLDEVGRDPGKLRIGFTTDALVFDEPEAQIKKAVLEAAKLCESLGHDVEEARPDFDGTEMVLAANVVVSSAMAASIDNFGAYRGAPVEADEVETLTWLIYENSKDMTGADLITAQNTLNRIGRRIAGFFERYDVLLLSTLGRMPVPVGYLNTNAEDLSDYGEKLYAYIPNTQPFNISGLPAMNVPLYQSEAGIPIGMQFVGGFGNEALLFRLASQLEQALPWAPRLLAGPSTAAFGND